MDDLTIIKELVGLAGSGGTVAVIFILWKLGIFKKNGNGDYKVLLDKIELLGTNHIHGVNDVLCDVNETLKRIESHIEKHGDKLDDVKESVVILKAKLLNGHGK